MGSEAFTTPCPPGFRSWVVSCDFRLVFFVFLFLPSPVLLRFINFGGFQVVPVVSRWGRTCVEVFHQRKSSDSTWAHRSGLISFWGENLLLHHFSLIHGVLVCIRPWSFGGNLPTPWWILVQSCKSIRVGLVEFWSWNRFFLEGSSCIPDMFGEHIGHVW